MRTTSGATHKTDRQRLISMRTPRRTQTPILPYGVHRSLTRRNPRIGYSANVSQLKFLDPLGISTGAQFIYLYLHVICALVLVLSTLTVWRVTGHRVCIHDVSFLPFFVWVYFGMVTHYI